MQDEILAIIEPKTHFSMLSPVTGHSSVTDVKKTMPIYSYAGATLASSFPLSALPETRYEPKKHPPDFTFNLLQSPPDEPADKDWLHHWQTPESNLDRSLATHNNGYLLRFPSSVDFVFSADGRHIGAWPLPGVDNETLQHLLLDLVLPRLLGHKGLMVLHASAVYFEEKVIAFAGETGRGKSTLAASMNGVGIRAICDDGLIVTPGDGSSTALPVYSGLRLWPESMATVNLKTLAPEPATTNSIKHRIVMKAQEPSTPLPLTAIYVLAPVPLKTDEQVITIEQLSLRDACIELMRCSFRLHINYHKQISDLLSKTNAIVLHTPVFTLKYPRDFSLLPQVHEAIIQHREKVD